MTPKLHTIGEVLYWAYANLAMAHSAITDGSEKYSAKHYAIRSKLFKGLLSGDMDIKSFFDDERLKMILPQACCYCGSTAYLAADHVLPRKKGGKDIGENLIWACRTCNSSKSDTDMLEWLTRNNKFPSVLLYRRYLKILIVYARTTEIVNQPIVATEKNPYPFNLQAIPADELPLAKMVLWVTDLPKQSVAQLGYRLATWNLERPQKISRKTQVAVETIADINPDIIVLTETSTIVDFGHAYDSLRTQEYPHLPNENWVAIHSKWKIKRSIPTFDSHRTLCVLIAAPFGDLIVYGTIIPYHMAGVNGGKYGRLGYKAWQMHEENIHAQSADWQKIIQEYPDTPFVIAGDFNQVRDGAAGGYGSTACKNLLDEKLAEQKLQCITALDFFALGKLMPHPKTGNTKRSVDHICVSSRWLNELKANEVGAWNHFDVEGYQISDHNGIYWDFATA